jgi:peptide/nickel transport system permease protein
MTGRAPVKTFFREWNLHKQLLLVCSTAAVIILCVLTASMSLSGAGLELDIASAGRPPSIGCPFGTDWLGRDMFTRTVIGLRNSLEVGLLSSFFSVIIALFLGLTSIFGSKRLDSAVGLLIDLCLGVPHLVLMVLISASLGGGETGVVTAVALTHWPSMTRLIRAEVLQIRSEHYVKVSEMMGKSALFIAFGHILPYVLPSVIVQSVLLFPHTILHEAAVTFLGFGLSPMIPAVGVILSESVQYIASGMWWLVVFPGLSLLIMVASFEAIGDSLLTLLDPYKSQL